MANANIEDIEDVITADSLDSNNQLKKTSYNIVKRQISLEETPHVDSFVPGLHKIYLKTWGCSHNNSDSEYMAGLLSKAGYDLTNNKDEADLCLLNSCTVKSPAEDHFRNEIKSSLDNGKRVVLAGCIPQGQKNTQYIKGLSIIGVQQIDKVCQVVEETLKGNSVSFLSARRQNGKRLAGPSLSLPKVRKNPLIEIIPINTGCLNNCTYCKTKHARGDLASYLPDEIINRARDCFQEGVVEIWLTSEDLGAYGRDINTNLPELLRGLVQVIPEGCRLRLGMTNPPYILEHLEEIADIMNHKRVYKFLHVPVQSGSDEVLQDMKREYTNEDFCKVCDVIKARVNEANIATDIICGFPTETDDNFEDTMKLVDKYRFASLFINQFFPRPGTPAARMQKIDPQEVKKRTKRLHELFHSYRPYDHLMDTEQDILITEMASDGINYVGHTESYHQVIVAPDPKLMGKIVRVRITETGKHFLKGILFKKSTTVGLLEQNYLLYLLSIPTITFFLFKLAKRIRVNWF
ncbi:unnamed protein product [Dimorphilus gyrociliatus]|uniref:tRNA-t(6)A37 methylthiotransferase n=1 Tax=Dimorphilus gyrociliatus TaxID=2664684 RepID=A0A7I8W5T7_9ANNE|nr:unnamed protein product [Dimorphilus gyrociliatus]